MISPHIQAVLDGIAVLQKPEVDAVNAAPPIEVSQITSKAGAFYEKIRYLVDYKEEHTIRRSAIERIILRLVNVEGSQNIGATLLQELVGGGYLSNNSIPESKAHDVERILEKFLFLLHVAKQNKHTYPGLNKKIISLAATEIDKFLKPQHIDELVVDAFYKTVVPHVRYAGKVTDKEVEAQIYIACRRSFLEEDQDTLFYALFRRTIPDWEKWEHHQDITLSNDELLKTLAHIELQLKNPLSWRFAFRLRNYALYFSVIRHITLQYGAEAKSIFEDAGRLETHVTSLLQEKYSEQHNKIAKSGFRAIFYIFLTKMIVGLGIELPYELYIIKDVDYSALGINVIFHPLLLFTMIKSQSQPGSENTSNIISGVSDVLTNVEIRTMHIKARETGIILNTLFLLLYAGLFIFSFGVIISVLRNVLNFNYVSIGLFIIFLTLVSYFGLRIRHNARKWKVTPSNEGVFGLLWSFFTLPIVRMGRWLSVHFATINILVLILDFIIETPFKLLLSILDSFISFLKEKREDPY